MKKTFKPTCLLPRLWVFSCLAGMSIACLASCGNHAPQQTPPLPSTQGKPPPPRKPSSYLGLTKQAAAARAAHEGRRWRVIREDGKSKPVTRDHRPNRLNFSIEQGVIVRVTKG